MGRQSRRSSPVGRIRREGLRVTAGPWTLFGLSGGTGRRIVALGGKAGGAVTRSRIRRIARTALGSAETRGAGVDLLLLARSQVSDRTRRRVRSELSQLHSRLTQAVARGRATQVGHD